MEVVTAGIGLLPGYGSIGWLAPALLVLLRAGQGVAVGGEYGGSAALVVEYAPATRRGWYGGWQWATIALGLAARAPLADTLRTARRSVVVGFGIVAAVTATFNIVFVFLPGHLAATGRAPLSPALVGLLVAAGAAPLAGRVSDRMGRRPLLFTGVVALLVLMGPVTALLLRGEPRGLVLGYSLIGLALGTLVPSTFLAELFPTRLRSSGLSLTYGLGSALFGGTAPALAAFLVRRTGATLSPAWCATALTAVALACVLLAPETAGRPGAAMNVG